MVLIHVSVIFVSNVQHISGKWEESPSNLYILTTEK